MKRREGKYEGISVDKHEGGAKDGAIAIVGHLEDSYCSHYCLICAPKWFNEAIVQYLKQNKNQKAKKQPNRKK